MGFRSSPKRLKRKRNIFPINMEKASLFHRRKKTLMRFLLTLKILQPFQDKLETLTIMKSFIIFIKFQTVLDYNYQ